ncbi:MAG: hypothetical protein ACM37W_12350 [Actinomycetota bacterium]
MAIDGKGIKVSVGDYDQSFQDFVALVSAFSVSQGVYAAVYDGNALVNFAIVVNLFREHGSDSITQAIRRVALDLPRLFSCFHSIGPA